MPKESSTKNLRRPEMHNYIKRIDAFPKSCNFFFVSLMFINFDILRY